MVLPLYTLGQCTASDDFAIHFCFQAVSKAGENNSHADRGPPLLDKAISLSFAHFSETLFPLLFLAEGLASPPTPQPSLLSL